MHCQLDVQFSAVACSCTTRNGNCFHGGWTWLFFTVTQLLSGHHVLKLPAGKQLLFCDRNRFGPFFFDQIFFSLVVKWWTRPLFFWGNKQSGELTNECWKEKSGCWPYMVIIFSNQLPFSPIHAQRSERRKQKDHSFTQVHLDVWPVPQAHFGFRHREKIFYVQCHPTSNFNPTPSRMHVAQDSRDLGLSRFHFPLCCELLLFPHLFNTRIFSVGAAVGEGALWGPLLCQIQESGEIGMYIYLYI